MTETKQKSSTAVTLLIGALMYTCLGLAVGVLWIYAAGEMGLAALGIVPFLALWWVWLMVWIPPIVVAVSIFRATDPIAQLAKNLDKQPVDPNTY